MTDGAESTALRNEDLAGDAPGQGSFTSGVTRAPIAPEALFALIDERMKAIAAGFGGQSTALGTAMADAVLARGKRFRAMLMLLAAEATGGVSEALVDAACAVEMVHTSSLIFDDLPCMDDAHMRRGRDALHVAHGESRAILAGIALITEANRVLARARGANPATRARLVAILSEALGPDGLCAGQELDLHAEKTDAGVLREQDLKTGVLFTASLAMLSEIQGLSEVEAADLHIFGTQLGRVFQSYDDLLDVLGEEAAVGKDVGRDAAAGLAHGILAVRGLAEATLHYESARAELDRMLRRHRIRTEALDRFITRVLPLRAPGG